MDQGAAETQAVTCPLPGLEAVEVVFNMMACQEDFDAWQRSVGRERTAEVIVEVRNWPADKYGPEPFGARAPMAFQIWACANGMKAAIEEYIAGPNSSTASTPSTPPTPTGASSRRRTPTPKRS